MCELTNGMAGERHGRGMLCESALKRYLMAQAAGRNKKRDGSSVCAHGSGQLMYHPDFELTSALPVCAIYTDYRLGPVAPRCYLWYITCFFQHMSPV